MTEEDSIVNIVKEHFGYIARDDSKSPQEKLLEVINTALKLTHQATKTNDQATLHYLFNKSYVSDLINQIQLNSNDSSTLTAKEGGS